MRKEWVVTLTLFALAFGYGAGNVTANQLKSSWLNPRMLEIKYLTNIEWQLHNYSLPTTDYVYDVDVFYSAKDRIVISYFLGERILSLPTRDSKKAEFFRLLKRDARRLLPVLWTDMPPEDFLEKHVDANWIVGAEKYAEYRNGRLRFLWDDK